MPRGYSLQRKKDFDTLFKRGTRRYSKYFTIVFAPSHETKFGLIVQKKNVARASRRNYSRRIVREILRKEYIPLIKREFWVAIIVKTDLKTVVKEQGFDALKNDLLGALRQVR